MRPQRAQCEIQSSSARRCSRLYLFLLELMLRKPSCTLQAEAGEGSHQAPLNDKAVHFCCRSVSEQSIEWEHLLRASCSSAAGCIAARAANISSSCFTTSSAGI